MKKARTEEENNFDQSVGGTKTGALMETTALSPEKKNTRGGISHINSVTEIVGYFQKRGDFETEYDADADNLLAEIEYNENDSEEEIRLKNEIVELYNIRLDERIRRKKFVIERGILDAHKPQISERKKTQEEKDIINAMKIFARFNSKEGHDKMVNNLLKEKQLRETIEQLKFLRSKGIQNLEECERFIEYQKRKD